jgi:hypothetical protein
MERSHDFVINVWFRCLTCNKFNLREAGMPGYEFKTTEFSSFSEAFDHKNEYYDHFMDAFVEMKASKEI